MVISSPIRLAGTLHAIMVWIVETFWYDFYRTSFVFNASCTRRYRETFLKSCRIFIDFETEAERLMNSLQFCL
jgi:hypothetical protein